MNIFERASRIRPPLRFPTTLGWITVEDLWDLPLQGRATNLDDIARELYRNVKETATPSFVEPATKEDERAQLAFDLVKHVIDAKIAERDAATSAAETKAKKTRLLELIARKQDEQLSALSVEELQAQIKAL